MAFSWVVVHHRNDKSSVILILFPSSVAATQLPRGLSLDVDGGGSRLASASSEVSVNEIGSFDLFDYQSS